MSCLTDNVTVAAVVGQRWRSCYPGARCDLELVLMANNILVLDARKATIEVKSLFFPDGRSPCQLEASNLSNLCIQLDSSKVLNPESS